MINRKKLVAATIVAGLVSGSALISKSFAEEAAAPAAGHEKAACKGKEGCHGKKAHGKKGKKAHAEKAADHGAAATEEHK